MTRSVRGHKMGAGRGDVGPMLNADMLRAFRDAPRPLSLTEALLSSGAHDVPPSRAMDALAVLHQAQLIDAIGYDRDADGTPTGPRRYTAV